MSQLFYIPNSNSKSIILRLHLCNCLISYIFTPAFLLTWRVLLFLLLAPQEETESTESKTGEQMKKAKGAAPQIRQKQKKESKKKR